MSRTSAILDRLERQPRWALIAGGAAWTLAIGALDWTTGTRVVLSFFYMLPVALAAWAGRRTAGVITALLTAAVWYIADAAATGVWFDAVQLWNVAVRLAFLVFVVVVVSSLQQTLARTARPGAARRADRPRQRARVPGARGGGASPPRARRLAADDRLLRRRQPEDRERHARPRSRR